jgi:hypothetical protein
MDGSVSQTSINDPNLYPFTLGGIVATPDGNLWIEAEQNIDPHTQVIYRLTPQDQLTAFPAPVSVPGVGPNAILTRQIHVVACYVVACTLWRGPSVVAWSSDHATNLD